jgi:hypothetical protein
MTTERRFAMMECNSHRPMTKTNARYESANGIKSCTEHVFHNSFTLRRIWASDGGERMIAHAARSTKHMVAQNTSAWGRRVEMLRIEPSAQKLSALEHRNVEFCKLNCGG